MLAGIEAGGTKFICGVGTGPEDLQTTSIPTGSDPDQTIAQIAEFFAPFKSELKACGIGSFGPVDLQTGYVTSTPKPGWAHFPLADSVHQALGVSVAFETDVSAALIGEARWGALRGYSDAVYITVGTGIGGGVLAGGHVVHGLVHPEIGHLRIPHDRVRDPFDGICPYHGDCWEGLACGPAIAARVKTSGADLPPTHEVWALEAHYIALAVTNIVLTVSPKRIVLGGGVMQRRFLFDMIRREVRELLAGYIRHAAILDHMDHLIVPPQLEERSGVLGAIAMAAELAPA